MGKVVGIDYEIAQQFGANAALVHNELQFWSNKKGIRKDGWIYKTYEEMTDRLPLSEQTIRRAYKKLSDAGLITTKIMKLNGTPVLHYKLAESETTNLADSKETTNLADSINTVTNTVTNTSRSSKMIMTSSGEITVDEFLSRIIVLVNKKEKVTEERTRQLRARLKDYTAVEIWKAAQAFSKSQWHRENGQMSIDNLIRPSKFGRWYAASNDKAASTASDGSAPEAQDRSNYDEEMRKMKEAQAEQAKRNAEFME